MQVQLLSDLHVEFMEDKGQQFFKKIDTKGVDVLIIAGDLGCHEWTAKALKVLCTLYPHVVFVAGNHEFYGSDRASVMNELQALSQEISNLHFLDNDIVIINGQRFLGTTLWFPEREDGLNFRYESWLNDFVQIEDFQKWVYTQNKASITFLEKNIKKDDIVVTHHIPTIEGVHPKWFPSHGTMGRFFLCQLERPILKTPKLWVFGHTHDSIEFNIGECHFVCNPFGYQKVQENLGYNPSLKLTV